jgi:CMP-N-acetylneuraminic acid synthetase
MPLKRCARMERSWPLGMSAEDSLDIDTPWDLRLVEYSLQTRF